MPLPKISFGTIFLGGLTIIFLYTAFYIINIMLHGQLIAYDPSHPERGMNIYYLTNLIFFNTVAVSYLIFGYMIGRIFQKINVTAVCIFIIIVEFYFLTPQYV